MIPGPWAGVLLALAVYRIVRLIGWDDFPLAAKIRDWVVGAEIHTNGSFNDRAGLTQDAAISVVRYRRPGLEKLISCPFCQGFWISCIAYAAWVACDSPGSVGESSWYWYAMMPWALSAAVGLTAKNLDP